MIPNAKRLSKAKQLPVDRISTLPPSIIENILCLVPIKEAARTSILSKDWKYNWTKIPKLVFDEDAFKVLTHEDEPEQMFEDPPNDRKKMTKKCRTFYAIYQVLLMHQGPIHEFTLSMEANNTCVEIDQILYHLSRNNNNVKKFTLDMRDYDDDGYRVPLSVFSLHKLTHLDLRKCFLANLASRPTINGFVNLTNLRLDDVDTTANTIIRLISKAPLLKSFTLIMHDCDLIVSGYPNNHSTIYDLFEPLQMIEHMTISVWAIKVYTRETVPRKLPTSFVQLKYFSLEGMFLSDEYALRFLVLMMRNSPNLEKLRLQMCNKFGMMDSVTFIEYSDIWLEHLTEVEVKDYCNSNPELELVTLILVKSPTLKKVSIWLERSVVVNEEVKMLKLLLRTPRASTMVDIIVERLP